MGPNIELSGQTALVTGASRGIGRAVTAALCECGANVIGLGTKITLIADDIKAELGVNSERFHAFDCDLSERVNLRELIERLDNKNLEIDILVNNAGIIRRDGAATHSDRDWDAVMAVNLDAVFYLSRELGSRMVTRGRGKIINIASVLSFQGGILVPSYAASKGAVAQLTKAFANEWASYGVNVNAVAPGYIATDNTASLKEDKEREAALMSRVPASRWGSAKEIAWPVAFLASDLASFMHGSILVADGGWLAR